MKFDKILIPLDGSRFAEAALPKAVELVRNNPDATLILLRAAEATTFPGVDPNEHGIAIQEFVGGNEEGILLQDAGDQGHGVSAEDVHHDAGAKLGEVVHSENGIRVLREDVVEARLVFHQVIHAGSILQCPFHVRHQSSQVKPAPLAVGERLLARPSVMNGRRTRYSSSRVLKKAQWADRSLHWSWLGQGHGVMRRSPCQQYPRR
jgi:nucleotide-binding universal stress UspA family protein